MDQDAINTFIALLFTINYSATAVMLVAVYYKDSKPINKLRVWWNK